MKIRGKILLTTVIICIITIISIFLANYYTSISKLEENVIEISKNESEIIAKEIDKWQSVQVKGLQEIIDNMILTNSFDYNQGCDYLLEARKRNEGNHYYIAMEDGEYIHPLRNVPDYDPRERPWYQGAIEASKNNEKYYISEPYIDSRTNNMVVSIATEFKTLDNKKGVISNDIQVGYLVDFIEKFDLGKNSYAFLTDFDGNILTHLNSEYIPSENGEYKNISEILDGKLLSLYGIKEDLDINKRSIKDF
ncbi:MAG TPA: cache domain-containing protein, partial [Tissierellaceae bacterium]